MSVESAVEMLRAGSAADVAQATALLQAEARSGDAEASRHLATMAAAGVGMVQSWSLALRYLFTACLGGSASARGQLTVLASDRGLANADPDTPNHWRALGASVRIEDWLRPCDQRMLNAAPRIIAMPGFLTQPVCAWLIGLAERRRPAAETGEARDGGTFELGIADCDLVVLLTRQRIAATLGLPAAALETSRILRHAARDPALGGAGFLVSLNDDFDGPHAHFPDLGLGHRGRAGDALHAKTPYVGPAPTRGEKWLFSQGIGEGGLA